MESDDELELLSDSDDESTPLPPSSVLASISSTLASTFFLGVLLLVWVASSCGQKRKKSSYDVE
jgi:hypothetical protein